MTQTIGGLDEAGRGPSLGPMVICGITFPEENLPILTAFGVRDSKLISPAKRSDLVTKITPLAIQIEIQEISAYDIDTMRAEGITLNEIEYRAFEKILSILKSDITYIDCPDVKPDRLCSRLMPLTPQSKLIVEHRADINYIACSAASILAKVQRDSIIEQLDAEYGPIGTGYMTDPRTQHFLQKWLQTHETFPRFVRSSWEPCKKMLRKKQNSTLKQYFPCE